MQEENVQKEPTISAKPGLAKPLFFGLILLIIILTGATGFLAYQNMQLQKQIAGMKVAASPSPVATTDPTASWKIYTNNDFNIKYPSNFYLNITGRGADYIGDTKPSVDQYLSNQTLNNNQLVITLISLIGHYDDNTLQQLANTVVGGSQQNVPYTTVNIAGIKAVKVIYNNVENYGIPTSYGFDWISAQPSTSNLISIFETMITTMKPSLASSSNWKVYDYPKFGYSFKVPSTYIITESESVPPDPSVLQAVFVNETTASQGKNDVTIYLRSKDLSSSLKDLVVGWTVQKDTKFINGKVWTVATSVTGEVIYLTQIGSNTYSIDGQNNQFVDQVLSTFKFIQ